MAIEFTPSELKYLTTCPDALRALAMYHEVEQMHADSVGAECHGNEIRQAVLLEEAARIEATFW